MKLFFLLLLVLIVSVITFCFFALFPRKKKKKVHWKKPVIISSIVFVVLSGFIVYGAYSTSTQPDLQCSSSHVTTTKLPLTLKSATDYFQRANYQYDIGNCRGAVADYSKAIALNPNFPQAYNNRAYTNMRLRNYKDALLDLNKTISLDPSYVQALMNRGDIHNYYYQIDRQAAISDYKRVITLIIDPSARQQLSVCGHLFLAEHDGWTVGAYLDFLSGKWMTCN